jgi:hypothetical protein
MSSKLLGLSAVVSTLLAVGHTNMGFQLTPVIATLSNPQDAHAGQNGRWQLSGYFLLNGIVPLQQVNIAIQQAKWAKYGITTGYDKALFWGMNLILISAGLGYATIGLVPPQFLIRKQCRDAGVSDGLIGIDKYTPDLSLAILRYSINLFSWAPVPVSWVSQSDN